MNVTEAKIKEEIKKRFLMEVSQRHPLYYLKSKSIDDYYPYVISILYAYTRVSSKEKRSLLSETVCTIGHSIRNLYGLPQDSASAARTGAFLIYVLEELQVLGLEMDSATNGHQAYYIKVFKDEILMKLWEGIPEDKVEKIPHLRQPEPYVDVVHNSGISLLKTTDADVLNYTSVKNTPMLFECVNRAMSVGWTINRPVYNLYVWCLQNRTDAFKDIWETQLPQAKTTKLREAKTIAAMAKKFIDKVFYHYYNYDFRYRRYVSSAYLNEQGSDNARGLLLRADVKAIGEEGFFWLMNRIATLWGGDAGRLDGMKTDKLPLKERAEWSFENEELLLSYAENPKVNQGWMKADKPWQFIAAVLELRALRMWQSKQPGGLEKFENYGYESALEAYIDGSANGSQHLAALTRDEISAPLVNLVPMEFPGDLYNYVGESVWQIIENDMKNLGPGVLLECNKLIDELIEIKKKILSTEGEDRKKYLRELQFLKEDNADIWPGTAPVYWYRVHDARHRRKLMKRGVMTIPYGSTQYGMG